MIPFKFSITSLAFSFLLSIPLSANLELGGPHATFSIEGDAELVLGQDVSIGAGILDFQSTTTTSNATIHCTATTLRLGDQHTALFTGDIDPGKELVLSGNHSIHAYDGFTLDNLTFSGTGNTVSGAPKWGSSITLSSATVTLAVSTPLTTTLALGGSNILLGADLELGADAWFTGGGNIETQGHALYLSSAYSSALSAAIHFSGSHGNGSANVVVLESDITLSNTWTFSEHTTIIGNGHTIAFTGSGALRIATNANLTLKDVTVEGVTSSTVVFEGGATAGLKLQNARIELPSDYALSAGIITVLDTATIILKDKNLTISSNGKLILDNATINLDVYTVEDFGTPGTLQFNTGGSDLKVYSNHSYQIATITAAVDATLLSKTNGDIREFSVASSAPQVIQSQLTHPLVAENITTDMTLEKSLVMGPADTINVTNNSVVNGDGSYIMLSSSTDPQITVAAGKTLTLNDVTLMNVPKNFLQLGVGAKLALGDKSVLILQDDVVISNGIIELVGDAPVVRIYGLGGPKHLTFKSESYTNAPNPTELYHEHLKLGTGTLALYSIILDGVRHISYATETIDDVAVTGTIGLFGASGINMNVTNTLNFLVQAPDNHFTLFDDNVSLNGSCRYGDLAHNSLAIRDIITPEAVETPRLTFGSDFMNLSSITGFAELKLLPNAVNIINTSADSFTIGKHGIFRGNTQLTLRYRQIPERGK